MKKPNINWFVKESDDIYTAHTEYYAGSCNPNEDFIIDVEIWNNRWNNTEDIGDAQDAQMILSFENAEDSVMLLMCEVKVNDDIFVKPDLSEFNRGVIHLGTISGGKNTGTSAYVNNYKRVTVKFSNIPGNFKDGLKSLFVDVKYNN